MLKLGWAKWGSCTKHSYGYPLQGPTLDFRCKGECNSPVFREIVSFQCYVAIWWLIKKKQFLNIICIPHHFMIFIFALNPSYLQRKYLYTCGLAGHVVLVSLSLSYAFNIKKSSPNKIVNLLCKILPGFSGSINSHEPEWLEGSMI